MDTMPDLIDFPHRVTGLLFEQTDRILVAYETYYKQKGTRVVTRPDWIPDNFERACDKVRIEMIGQEQKAIDRSAAAFATISTVLRRIEELDAKLPEMVLTQFCDTLERNVATKLEAIEVCSRHHKCSSKPL